MQCALPVFEDLLPKEHDSIVLDLLFDLAVWHGYAKLRLHTDDTLGFFDTATVVLGQSVRKFSKHVRTITPLSSLMNMLPVDDELQPWRVSRLLGMGRKRPQTQRPLGQS
jgi:hypothetical protein